MHHNRIIALLAVAALLAGCSASPAAIPRTPASRPKAQLGTVAPAYPVGQELTSGIEVIDKIPIDELDTTGSVTLDEADPCASVPTEVVTSAGFNPIPVVRGAIACIWRAGSGLRVMIGAAPPRTMAEEVAEHVKMATGKATDPLAHLVWLLIDGHYAIERMLKFDQASSCWISVDLGSPTIAHVSVYTSRGHDPDGRDPDTAMREYCPASRTVAQNLLRHLRGQPLDPAGSGLSTAPTR